MASQLGTLQPSGPLSSSRRISNLRTGSLRKGPTRASEILRNPPSRRAGEPSSLHMGSLWKGPTRASGILRAGGARRAGEPPTLGLSFRGVPPASRIRNGRLSLAGPGKDWHMVSVFRHGAGSVSVSTGSLCESESLHSVPAVSATGTFASAAAGSAAVGLNFEFEPLVSAPSIYLRIPEFAAANPSRRHRSLG